MKALLLQHYLYALFLLLLMIWAGIKWSTLLTASAHKMPFKRISFYLLLHLVLFVFIALFLRGMACFGVDIYFWLQASIFAFLGAAALQWSYLIFQSAKELPESVSLNPANDFTFHGLIFSVITLVLLVLLAIFYQDTVRLLSPFAALAYLLPILLSTAFRLLLGIPPPVYNYWSTSRKKLPVLPDGNTVKLRMRITGIPGKNSISSPYFEVPERMCLGDMYDYFIVQYNQGEDLKGNIPTDFNGIANKWALSLITTGKRKRVLNTALALSENKLKDEDFIEARLISEKESPDSIPVTENSSTSLSGFDNDNSF